MPKYFQLLMMRSQRLCRCYSTSDSVGSRESCLYKLLGVRVGDDQAAIKRAFYEQSRLHHPDRPGTDSAARFKDISAAYEVLGNPARRRQYDLREGYPTPGQAADEDNHSTDHRSLARNRHDPRNRTMSAHYSHSHYMYGHAQQSLELVRKHSQHMRRRPNAAPTSDQTGYSGMNGHHDSQKEIHSAKLWRSRILGATIVVVVLTVLYVSKNHPGTSVYNNQSTTTRSR